MQYLQVKNWDTFQQYHDRDPKWIKVYRHLLDDYEFTALPDAVKFQLIGIWLLAAKIGNKIPNDPKWIAARINASTSLKMELLLSSGFIEPYIPSEKSVQDRTGMYLEERREEKSREEEEDSSEPLPRSDPQPAFLTFKCVGDPGEFHLEESKAAEYETLYGSVIDVRYELRKAHQWLVDNPGRRKTANGMTRFLNAWLSKAVDSGRGNGASSKSKPKPPHEPLATRMRRYNAEHPGNSLQHVLNAVDATPEERAEFEQQRRARLAQKRDPGDVTPIAEIIGGNHATTP